MAKAEDDLVLLIHGTYAAPEKGRLKWWEVGSNAWKDIEKRLPAGTRLAAGKEIFHWSGDNQERDRCHAGVELLNRILKLEKQGRPYHLIGHSHGGSVIWHALQESVRRRVGRRRPDPRLQLPNLRSWTTVGTPFLQYCESRMGRWPGAVLTKLLFVVSWSLTFYLGFALLEFLSTVFADDIDDSLWEGDLNTLLIVGVVCVTAMAIVSIPGLALHVWASAIRREALTVRQTSMVRNHAMMEFGSRWLGVWSRQDEAISGLKATVKLRMQLLPRLQFRTNRVFQYDRRIWSYRFLLRWLLAPILNTTFVPYGNSVILSTVSKSAQGDDRPGCKIISVSEGPICFQDRYRYPSLPPRIDEVLEGNANKHLIAKAPEFVPKIRSLLADYSSGVALLGGAIKDSGFAFDGNEMVHTSYFDNGNVLDLLAHHVQSQQQSAPVGTTRKDSLAKWYQATRQEVGHNVVNNRSVQKQSLIHLAKRNRRARWSVFLSLVGLICLGFAYYYFDLAKLPSLDTLTWRSLEESKQVLLCGASIPAGLLGMILGRSGQLAAERGARFRRIATLGVNLGLLWLVVSLPMLADIAMYFLQPRL